MTCPDETPYALIEANGNPAILIDDLDDVDFLDSECCFCGGSRKIGIRIGQRYVDVTCFCILREVGTDQMKWMLDPNGNAPHYMRSNELVGEKEAAD